jgi:hypothetical protein
MIIPLHRDKKYAPWAASGRIGASTLPGALLAITELVQAGSVCCHRTNCPLLMAFFLLLFLSDPVTFLPEEVIVGFQNFVWGFKSQKKIRFGIKQKLGAPPAPWVLDFFRKKEKCGGSSVRRPGSEDPHRRQRKLLNY